MEEIDGGRRMRRSGSFLGRSRSSRMLLDSSISSDCAHITKYERLSKSTRSRDEPPRRERRVAVWRLLSHALAWKESAVVVWTAADKRKKKKKEEKKKRRWSSWLPDPDRRWPVQGW